MTEAFAARGTALWSALEAGRDLTGGNFALAVEACRIADRLDRLEALLSGDGETWFRLRLPRDGSSEPIRVVVNNAMGEARQQANILRQIVAGLPVKGDDDNSEADRFLDGLAD